MSINVTKTFLPPFEEYTSLLKKAWDKAWLTNNGMLVQELEQKLKEYLNVKNLLFCNNGTIVLQMALKALNITGEVITTPFSYVATTTAILWENCAPVFVDIDAQNFCIDPFKIEAAITEKTQAILATHVYGYPCDVLAIEAIAKKHNLKVIYDAAHAFGTTINGQSVLSYGDVSTCSFHATKLFHSGEGGCIITPDDALNEKLFLYRSFGHIGDNYYSLGINGKNSELHAAMGLAVFPYLGKIMASRKEQWKNYQSLFADSNIQILRDTEKYEYNYAYFPVVFPTEEDLHDAIASLRKKDIFPRRYFFPALNTLHYVNGAPCPIAESIAVRTLCLPLYHDLLPEEQTMIANTVLEKQKARP